MTAVLLKIALGMVIIREAKVINSFHAATARRGKVTARGSRWVVAAGSKRPGPCSGRCH